MNLQIVQQRLQQTMLTLPYKVGVICVAYSKQRFQQQNWQDAYPDPWKPRKKNTKWKTRKSNSALLVKTGRLRRSIRIISTTSNSVTIGSDVPYAAAHNDGLRLGFIQNVGKHTRRKFIKERKGSGMYSVKTRKEKMRTVKTVGGEIEVKAHIRKIDQNIPRRRFLGESKYLNMQINRLISAEINKTFRV